jgi:2-amino-4-hydroxy-6-hydroxymethyldihydropteridine diphosphokinase/dihydropteroate synthase
VDDELARILPVIEIIKSLPGAEKVAISIDTYRSAVAEEAIKAGAHIINDISAGKLDPKMLPTVARLGCTYVMMHMRGTPATMQDEENCIYPAGVVRGVIGELHQRLLEATDAGIRPWHIILDPGIGFSKTTQQNLELLQGLPKLREKFCRYPWLIGSSRKSFIGKITGVEAPAERQWGTAATVAAAVLRGASIVRVHDVQEMATVAKMAGAIRSALSP